MASFKGLSEIVREQIAITKETTEFPAATPEAAYFGTNTNFIAAQQDTTPDVFIWGVSTWGIESIVGADFPEDLE